MLLRWLKYNAPTRRELSSTTFILILSIFVEPNGSRCKSSNDWNDLIQFETINWSSRSSWCIWETRFRSILRPSPDAIPISVAPVLHASHRQSNENRRKLTQLLYYSPFFFSFFPFPESPCTHTIRGLRETKTLNPFTYLSCICLNMRIIATWSLIVLIFNQIQAQEYLSSFIMTVRIITPWTQGCDRESLFETSKRF